MAFDNITTPISGSQYNLARAVTEPTAFRTADRIALTMLHPDDREIWTWGMVWARMAAWQRFLVYAQLTPGDRLVICLPNCIDIPTLMLAASAMALVPVVLSPQLRDREILEIEAHCGATVRIGGPTDHSVRCHVVTMRNVEEEFPQPIGEDALPSYHDTLTETPAYMVYTSGTSGSPHGVLHAHRAVAARQSMIEGWTGMRSDDIVLHAGQLNWTYTMGIAIFDAWRVGAHAVIYEGDRHAVPWATWIQQENATIFAAVPSIYRQLVRDVPNLAEATATLRHGVCAGEPLLAPLHNEWVRITRKPLYEALGMSECSTYVSSGPATPTRPGSPGRAQKGRTIAILPIDGGTTPLGTNAVGLLAIHRRDPGLMLGYYRDQEATEKAFRGNWFITGDIASLDEDRYLHYHGRSDDMINALGYRVGPSEVESVLVAHPKIEAAAVTGFTPRDGVTLVAAHLVLASTVHWTDEIEAEIRAWVDDRLAAYKRPRVYRIHDALPRNRSGKIMRRVLRQSDVNPISST